MAKSLPLIPKKQNQTVNPPLPSNNSAYQENISQPVQPDKWYKGDYPTEREIYGHIGTIYQQDPAQASQFLNRFRAFQATPGNMYYNPYTQATNQAVSSIGQYGIDTSNMDDAWRESNRWLMNHYITGGTTNNPTKPGKKATMEELAAYDFYQIDKAWDDTANANKELAALNSELSYWATASDRNYTDDEIIEKVYGKNGEASDAFKKKYPTLYKMDEGRKAGTPLELNTPVGYSYAGMYGTIWNARNGDSVDNPEVAITYSAMGVGNQYQENPELRAKLDPKSDSYSPYSVGSTLEAERVYFKYAQF